MRVILNLPREEPPSNVREALRIVMMWLREVEAREKEVEERYREMQQRLQNTPPVRDWRDEL